MASPYGLLLRSLLLLTAQKDEGKKTPADTSSACLCLKQATTCATLQRPADASVGALCRYQPDTGACVGKREATAHCAGSGNRKARAARSASVSHPAMSEPPQKRPKIAHTQSLMEAT